MAAAVGELLQYFIVDVPAELMCGNNVGGADPADDDSWGISPDMLKELKDEFNGVIDGDLDADIDVIMDG